MAPYVKRPIQRKGLGTAKAATGNNGNFRMQRTCPVRTDTTWQGSSHQVAESPMGEVNAIDAAHAVNT